MELSNVFTSNRQGGSNTAKVLKPCLDAGQQNTLGSTKEYGLYEHSKETWNILGYIRCLAVLSEILIFSSELVQAVKI